MKNGHVEEKYYLALQGHGPERVSSQKQSSQNGLMRKSSPFFKNGGSQKKPTVFFFFDTHLPEWPRWKNHYKNGKKGPQSAYYSATINKVVDL